MKRTTISLPDDLGILLEREAKKRGASISEIARTALAHYLGLTGKKRQVPFAALGKSGSRHTARDMEQILAEEWDRAGHS